MAEMRVVILCSYLLLVSLAAYLNLAAVGNCSWSWWAPVLCCCLVPSPPASLLPCRKMAGQHRAIWKDLPVSFAGCASQSALELAERQ